MLIFFGGYLSDVVVAFEFCVSAADKTKSRPPQLPGMAYTTNHMGEISHTIRQRPDRHATANPNTATGRETHPALYGRLAAGH